MQNSENNSFESQVDSMVGAMNIVSATNQVDLYDANAIQKVPVYLDDEEEIEPIILTVEPLKDPRYIEYANNTAFKVVDDGNAITRAASQPLGKLFDNLVTDCENVEFEGGERPENWKDVFDLLQFKIPTMTKYLIVAVYEKPKTNNGKVVFGITNERVIFADLYFNGKPVTTTHYIQKSNYEFAKDLEKSQKMPFGSKAKGLQESGDYALPNSVQGKADLYEKMKTREADGFVDNIVPIRVKTEIIDFIAKSQLKEKKS